jgi:hypothetical protein
MITSSLSVPKFALVKINYCKIALDGWEAIPWDDPVSPSKI